MEAPKFKPLGTGPGTEPRTLKASCDRFAPSLSSLATQADRDILSDIDAFTAADQLGFLTGKLSSENDIFRRIDQRVKMAIAKLNEMGPPNKIKAISTLRFFSKGKSQSKIVFNKFFLVGGMQKKGKWDTLPAEFHVDGDPKKKPDVKKWRATPTNDRFEIIVKYSALPGASRHHWNTEVDVNSVKVDDWEPGGKFFDLGRWLTDNSAKVGLIQSYNPGRPPGGYSDEPWHLSYAPIAVGLLKRYKQTVNLQTDVIDAIVAEFESRAKEKKLTLPDDFATGLAEIDVSSLVKTVHPAVQPPP